MQSDMYHLLSKLLRQLWVLIVQCKEQHPTVQKEQANPDVDKLLIYDPQARKIGGPNSKKNSTFLRHFQQFLAGNSFSIWLAIFDLLIFFTNAKTFFFSFSIEQFNLSNIEYNLLQPLGSSYLHLQLEHQLFLHLVRSRFLNRTRGHLNFRFQFQLTLHRQESLQCQYLMNYLTGLIIQFCKGLGQQLHWLLDQLNI